MKDMEKIRVMLVDDHAVVRSGLADFLLAYEDLELAGEASSGEDAVLMCGKVKPDVVLMDVRMPVMDGIAATRILKEKMPELQVVMLTAFEDDAHLFDALAAGAQGYLLKSLGGDEFAELLQGLVHGEAPLAGRMVTKLIKGLAEKPAEGRNPDRESTHRILTERELSLMGLVARGLSNKAIGVELNISENTVKYHLKNIFLKLGLKNRAEAAAYAVHEGLVERPDDDDPA